MVILLYALATVACGAMAVRAPLVDRDDPVRRAYAWLGIAAAVTWLGWTLYLVPGFGIGKIVNGAGAAFLPPTLLGFLHQFFSLGEGGRDRRVSQLSALAPLVVVVYALLELFAPWKLGQAGPADFLLGLWVFGGLTLSLRRLWQRHQASTQRIERSRIRYLLALAASAVAAAGIESIVRAVGQSGGEDPSFFAREGFVQGAIPPLGALLTTTFLYFLYQMLSVYRLLDLAEIFSRVGAVAIAAAILVLLASISAVSLLGPYPTHALFQAFVASVLFLLAWDPLRKHIERWLAGIFNPRGLALDEAIADLGRTLPRAISLPELNRTILDRFVASGRVTNAAIYLWDEERRIYRLFAERGGSVQPAVLSMARQPFVDGFVEGIPAYLRVELERRMRRDEKHAEEHSARLRAMAQMNAALVVPFQSGDLVLGWLALADEADSEGFSDEEVSRIAAVALRACLVLENIQSFDRLKEEHRLSALGTMAAGLAHEIRNPLAGIRGAAQFLESTRSGDDAEMVRVIVEETDRLNRIVAQFLDYARELRLHPESISPAELVSSTVRALLAQGVPSQVRVVEDVAENLPPLVADAVNLRQVLLNLGLNAIQAMSAGGTLHLRVRRGVISGGGRGRTEAVEFVVEDTGPGIAAEDVDKLFVPFFTTRHDGTGLGLAISQRIVQAHHGEIDVRSIVGQGTRFFVRLPAVGSVAATAAVG